MDIQCPSCATAVDVNAAVCPVCSWPMQSGPTPTIPKSAPGPKHPCDLTAAITVDRSGSSKKVEAGIPAALEIIVRQIQRKLRSAVFTLQSHSDLDYGEPHVLLTDRGTPEQAIADMRRIEYDGGGDAAETHLDAIEHLLRTVSWPADPRRGRGVIIAYTTDETKPNRSGLSARDLGAEIHQRGLLLYLISEPTPTLQDLVEAAHGILLPITNDPDPATLQKIAAQLSASILGTVASGRTEPMPVFA